MELEPRRYKPAETAKRLGITTQTLAQWRRDGKIVGVESKNVTEYTDQQIADAELRRNERKKPGPKPGPKPRLGRAKYEWPEDDDKEDTSLKHRWRICDTGGSSTQESRQAVGA